MHVKIIAPIVTIAVVLAASGLALWSNNLASHATAAYQQKRHVFDTHLKAARQAGYTDQDLQPVTSRLNSLDNARDPWWVPVRPGYYEDKASQVTALQAELDSLTERLLAQARTDAGKQLDSAKGQVAQSRQDNAPDPDIQVLQQRLDAAGRLQAAGHTIRDYRAVSQQARGVATDAGTLHTQTVQENEAVQQAAQQLIAQTSGNLGAIQQAGNQALAGGRNDASVASYMNKPSAFHGYDAIQRAYSRLEKFASMIGSSDLNVAAQGTAGVQRYAGTVHQKLMAGLPAQVVIVSFQDQHLWAYQHDQLVMENAVTTGVRGTTDFGTDFGPMKVLWKSHPWTMHSPWPKGSPYYYPDTVVQWTTFFTRTGESIHDANWEPDSLLGPGSQFNTSTRSHGCVHIPAGKAEWMYNWAPVGMPVIVYPGDGTPVANQLSQITTDDQGNPQSAG